MHCHLLVQFKVKQDQVATFVAMLQESKSRIASAPGCLGVEVLQSLDHKDKVALSEIWESREHHDDYADKMRASGAMNQMAPFLAGPPEAEFFAIS